MCLFKQVWISPASLLLIPPVPEVILRDNEALSEIFYVGYVATRLLDDITKKTYFFALDILKGQWKLKKEVYVNLASIFKTEHVMI